VPPDEHRPGSGDQSFAVRIIAWQRVHGRHDLPWQGTTDPYRIWLSEIMLQQTQVAAVIDFYQRFLARLPSLAALADAPEEAVMALWSGLGYYSRARNLHACARRIVRDFKGEFPEDVATLVTLPGIGRSTAAAIAAFTFGARAAILDGNVKRVFARYWAIEGWPGTPRVEKVLWKLAEQHLPPSDINDTGNIQSYTQGLMDLGATLCTRTRPQCQACPLNDGCAARALSRTADFPASKPRREVPVRSMHMLVTLHNGEVLLEKRPPTGIWGGLWSLPEFASLATLEAWVLAHLAGASDLCDIDSLEECKHSFTHYTLMFTPHVVHLRSKPMHAEQNGRLWLHLDEAATAALPAPIKRLFAQLGTTPQFSMHSTTD
jgi:A/G-specific adenine glycosylase